MKLPKNVPLLDLQVITRNPEEHPARVYLEVHYERVTWIQCGEVSLRRWGKDNLEWYLEARVRDGVTDLEHDSAYAFRLPLVGVQLGELGVHHHITHLIGWISGTREEDFHIPPPEYDPTKIKGAQRCKNGQCLKEGPKSHIIVPDGYWMPPVNKELFNILRGHKVEITIGSLWD